MRFSGTLLNADGSLRTIEIMGPPNLEAWKECFAILSTAYVMLDVVDLGVLNAYCKNIERLYSRYGQSTWAILYQTDVRFRLEHLLRIKRQYADAHDEAKAAGHDTPYEVDRPWNYSFDMGLKDSDWWLKEVNEPAMAALTKMAGPSAVEGDAPISSR